MAEQIHAEISKDIKKLSFLRSIQSLNEDREAPIVHFPNTTIWFAPNSKSPSQNYALFDKPLSPEELSLVETEYITRDKIPAAVAAADDTALIQWLKNNNYTKKKNISWFFFEGSITNSPKHTVKKVESEEQLDQFIETFDGSFQEDDPKNPWGKVTDFLGWVRDRWYQFHDTNELQYFIAYEDQQPSAVSALQSRDGIGYLFNVGSLQSVRGKGFGKAVTMHAIKASMEMGNKLHCLNTQAGHYAYQFYIRQGFEERFQTLLFVKNTHS